MIKRRTKYIDISDIIESYIQPRVKSECERLGIPPSFIDGIYGIYHELFGAVSCCEPVREGTTIKAVRIRIDSEIRCPQKALRHFGHELRHAQDIYENKKSPEWKADLYAWKRCLCQLLDRDFPGCV